MQRKTGMLAVFVSGVLFGLNPLLAKTVYANGGNAMTTTLFRLAFAAALFWLICAAQKLNMHICKGELLDIIYCSIGYAITPILLLSSYNYVASGLATTIHFVYPVLVLLGCVLVFHDRLDRRKLLCCALCMVGIVCFYTPGGEISLRGMLIAFASGGTYACYTLCLSHSSLLKMNSAKCFAWVSTVSTVMVLPLPFLFCQYAAPQTTTGWVVLGVFCLAMIGAGLFYQYGAKSIGAADTALFSTLEPLTSVVIGAVVYHEVLTVRSVAGIVCVLTSVFLLATAKETKQSD